MENDSVSAAPRTTGAQRSGSGIVQAAAVALVLLAALGMRLISLPDVPVRFTQSVIPIGATLFIICEALSLPEYWHRLRAGISADVAEVTGDLTLLGQTHTVTLNVTLNNLGPAPNNQRRTAGFSATGSLNRSAWGSATAANLIGDAVSIQIEALAQVPAAAN